MDKPRVLFPFTEAGLGHIMPMTSIADAFEKLYGDKVECVRSNFFVESKNKNLKIFEDRLKSEVVHHNRHMSYGFFATYNMEFWGVRISSWATMRFLRMGSFKPACKFMDELKPDLVVSTHWATNYYAKKCKCKPLTVMYCPDAQINPLFRYPCDIAMISNSNGYERALKRHPVRLNKDNFKLVPFLIRKEAFDVRLTKAEARAKLGLDENKFTIVLAEGGYGIGKMPEICKIAIERDLPVTLIPVCGKNEELYKELLTWQVNGKTDFRPMGLINNMFEVLAASDLFCGKSGANMLAEPTFFGIPQIVTKHATNIEKQICKYYVDIVGSALKIFEPKKVVDKIEEFFNNPEELEPLRQAALAQKKNYGAEECAKIIFELLCTKFPHLKD